MTAHLSLYLRADLIWPLTKVVNSEGETGIIKTIARGIVSVDFSGTVKSYRPDGRNGGIPGLGLFREDPKVVEAKLIRRIRAVMEEDIPPPPWDTRKKQAENSE